MKEDLVKTATRADFLRQFRNIWMEKMVAAEIDLKMAMMDKIVTSDKSANTEKIIQMQAQVKRAIKFIEVIDSMMQEEAKKQES